MTEHDSSSARFAIALRRLYEQAGSPTYDRLIRLASGHKPRVALSRSALSDWLSGKTLPASESVVVFVVSALAADISDRAERDAVDLDSWRRAWRQARSEKSAHRRADAAMAENGRTPTNTRPLGQTVADLDDTDAFGFGVHRAVDLPAGGEALSALPAYLQRAHDAVLRAAVDRARTRTSMVVVVGNATTGKTRACWEAVRTVLPDWRIWQPMAPTRSTALIEGIRAHRLAARTVLWLDEAHLYLASSPSGEHTAAVLHELLHESADGPFLILATLWPDYWDELTAPATRDGVRRSDGQTHPAAGALLRAAQRIVVPHAFTDEDLARFAPSIAADPRLATAAAHGAGRLTQRLAGAVELTSRYELADDAARAILCAAMDARRFGLRDALPAAFLREAATHYLDPRTGNPLAPSWWESALTYLRQAGHGIPGPLIQGRGPDGGPCQPERYHLADYLDELGRTVRRDDSPPAGFWAAALDHVDDPAGLTRLAIEARARGRGRWASALEKRAADLGDTTVLLAWAGRWYDVGEAECAIPLLRQAVEAGDRGAVVGLANTLIRFDCTAEATNVLEQALLDDGPATQPDVLVKLAELRMGNDDVDGASELLGRAVAAGGSVVSIADLYDKLGDHATATLLIDRAIATIDYTDGASGALASALASHLYRTGDSAAAEALAADALRHGHDDALSALVMHRSFRAGDPADLDDLLQMAIDANAMTPVRAIALHHQWNGRVERARDLLVMAAERGDTRSWCELAVIAAQNGDLGRAEELLHRAIDVGDASAYVELAVVTARIGQMTRARRLARRAADAGYAHKLRSRIVAAANRPGEQPLEWLAEVLKTIDRE